LIVTKSDLIARDDYIEVLDPKLAHIQITITSTNDELAATYEHATRPTDRIKAIEKLWAL
jgi:DNA repair photolyase